MLTRYVPTRELLWRAFDRAIADSKANPWARRSDDLNRVEAEDLAQEGVLLPEVQELLGNPEADWPHNVLVYEEKDDGSLRPIEIPAIRVHIASDALRAHFEPVLPLPDNFYARRRRVPWERVGLVDALQRVVEAGAGRALLKLDIQNFFGAIPHEVVRESLSEVVASEDIEAALRLVTLSAMERESDVLSHKEGQGLAQGNPLCPMLAQWVIRNLPERLADLVDAQVWYVDDFVVVPKAGVEPEGLLSVIEQELDQLGLALKHRALEDVLFEPKDSKDFRFLGVPVRQLAMQVVLLTEQDRQNPETGWAEESYGIFSQLVGEHQRVTSTGAFANILPLASNQSENRSIKGGLINSHSYAVGGDSLIATRQHSDSMSPGEQGRSLQGSGVDGTRSFTSTDHLAPWVYQTLSSVAPRGRRPSILVCRIDCDDELDDLPDEHELELSLDGLTGHQMPETEHEVVVAVFGHPPTLDSSSRRRQLVADTIRRLRGCVAEGGILLGALRLSDFHGLWACQGTQFRSLRPIPEWACAIDQPSGVHVFVWMRASTSRWAKDLQANVDVDVKRIGGSHGEGLYKVSVDSGHDLFTSRNNWMMGERPRHLAALYDTVAAAIRRLPDSEQYLVVRHHPDLQTQLLSTQKPQKSYLQKPIRNLRTAVRQRKAVTFVPVNRGRVNWANVQVIRSENTECRTHQED